LADFDRFQANLADTTKSDGHLPNLADFEHFSAKSGGCPADLPDF